MTSQKELQKMVAGLTDEQYRRAQFPWNRPPEHNTSIEIKADRGGYIDMSETYMAVEQKLSEHGIEIRIKNFAQFEGATQMLNRIDHDINYL